MNSSNYKFSEVTMKKQFNAIDVLKFVMAMFVVMIHVKPNAHSENLTMVLSPFLSIAVPVFFIISSMLIFSKLNSNGGGYCTLLKYCKRIGSLYLSWFIIDFWYIWTNKSYFSTGAVNGTTELFKDLIFSTTFPGSWYLSASVMGVVIVYLLNKIIHPVMVFLMAYLVSYYIGNVELFPDYMHGIYNWYASTFREEVTLSFPAQMVWISIGQMLALYLNRLDGQKKHLLPSLGAICILAFIACMLFKCVAVKIVLAVSLVLICLQIDLPSKPIYKRLRNYSILMFFFHFSIAGKMALLTRYVGDTLLTNWIYYLLVVTVSIAFAEAILRLEKKPFFKILKYTH